MPSLPPSLLVRFDLRNCRQLRPVGKSGARKTYLWWRRIKLENILTNWTYTSPCSLVKCIHEHQKCSNVKHMPRFYIMSMVVSSSPASFSHFRKMFWSSEMCCLSRDAVTCFLLSLICEYPVTAWDIMGGSLFVWLLMPVLQM